MKDFCFYQNRGLFLKFFQISSLTNMFDENTSSVRIYFYMGSVVLTLSLATDIKTDLGCTDNEAGRQIDVYRNLQLLCP